MMRVDVRGRVREIEGSHVEDELRAHREVHHAARRRARRASPWRSGSFYLLLFVIVMAALLVVGRVVPVWALPWVVAGGLLAVGVVGVLQLRHDERLSEQGFLRVMGSAIGKLPESLTRRTLAEQTPSDQDT